MNPKDENPTSRALIERVKEYGEEGNSTIYKYSTNHLHPYHQLTIIIDQGSSQVILGAKEAVHIRMLYPDLNWNIGNVMYTQATKLYPVVVVYPP